MVRKVASYTNGKCNYPFFVFKTYNAWNSAEVRGKHGVLSSLSVTQFGSTNSRCIHHKRSSPS
jgi:hypothetical protein